MKTLFDKLRCASLLISAIVLLFFISSEIIGRGKYIAYNTSSLQSRAHHDNTQDVNIKILPTTYYSPTPFPVYKVNQFMNESPQNEPSVRVNPKDPNNIVAAYRDFRFGWSNNPIRSVAVATTTDGGITWIEQLAEYLDHNRFSDPAVGVDTAGNFYVATVNWLSDAVVTVRKSTDGGFEWLRAVPVGHDSLGYDKDMIYVDDSPTSPFCNNIYVSWKSPGVKFTRSTDLGLSFMTPIDLNPYLGATAPTTGPDGEIYVVGTPAYVTKSIDGGLNFGDTINTEDPVHPAEGWGIMMHDGIWSLSEPVIAVDKSSSIHRGTVYITYVSTALGDGDLFCVKSTDGGTSWSQSVRVNNDTIGNNRDQFHFWMTVDDSGFVDVVFLDRRNDPDNILCDAYFAQSRDGGRTFKNFKLTSQNFDPRLNYNGAVRLGEYIGIDARQSRIVPIWVDTHLGNQDVYIAVIDQDKTASISGRVTDEFNNGLSQAALLLFHDNGIDSVHTDNDGYYIFSGLFPATYVVSMTESVSASPPLYTVPITSHENESGKDFIILPTGISQSDDIMPTEFSLSQNYPNPFNPTTVIMYTIPTKTFVHLSVYNLLGQEIITLVNENREAGRYEVQFNASGLTCGVYVYSMNAGYFVQIRKMLLLR